MPKYDIAIRAQVVTLNSMGLPWAEIERITKISRKTCCNIVTKARSRGYNPEVDPRLSDAHLEDGPRLGRPRKLSADTEIQLIQSAANGDADAREASFKELGSEFNVSARTVLTIFRRHRTTKKPVKRSKSGVSKAVRGKTTDSAMMPNSEAPPVGGLENDSIMEE